MTRRISIIDYVFYVGICLVSAGAGILAYFTDQEWGTVKTIITLSTLFLISTMSIVILVAKHFTRPDFVTKHGVGVWIGELIITKYMMTKSIDFYIKELCSRCTDFTEDQILFMLKDACIEWRSNLVSMIGIGWVVKDKYGLQQGKNIRLRWREKLSDSALFHELHHMVDELVLGNEPDYAHKRKDWWTIEQEINDKFRKLKY